MLKLNPAVIKQAGVTIRLQEFKHHGWSVELVKSAVEELNQKALIQSAGFDDFTASEMLLLHLLKNSGVIYLDNDAKEIQTPFGTIKKGDKS